MAVKKQTNKAPVKPGKPGKQTMPEGMESKKMMMAEAKMGGKGKKAC